MMKLSLKVFLFILWMGLLSITSGFIQRVLSFTARVLPFRFNPSFNPVNNFKIFPFPSPNKITTLPPAPEDTWPTFRNRTLANLQSDFQELDNKRSPFRLKPVLLGRVISWALSKIVRTHTETISNLDLSVHSQSNHDILRGNIDTIDMKFQKISFQGLHVSGGGRLLLKGIDIRLRRFFFQNLQVIRKPYLVYADLLFTQQDIINSKLIRNLIQLLVNTILERVFSANKILSASIRKVSINARRIQAQGTAKLLLSSDGLLSTGSGSGSASRTVRIDSNNDNNNNDQQAALYAGSSNGGLASVDFEVSTGAAMRDQGQILYLRDIQVALNPDSILRTFIPIVTTTPIDVDLGDDCRIESLVIANKNIWIRAASVISPVAPFSVADVPSKALYKYDLAGLFSKIMWFNGGLATKWRPGWEVKG